MTTESRPLYEEVLGALKGARQFIRNGIEYGYIRMPDADCPDTAHDTPGELDAAIAKLEAALPLQPVAGNLHDPANVAGRLAWVDEQRRTAEVASPVSLPQQKGEARDAAPQYGMTGMVAMALKPFCKPGEKVIWREPFRWKDEDGVLSNHYEMFDLSQLAEDFDYVIVEDFGSAAIIARKDGQPFAIKEKGTPHA